MRQTNPIHRLKACCSTRIACLSGLLTFRHCFSLLYSIWFPHSSICFIWIFSSESLFHTVRQYGWTHQLGSATGGNSHLAVFFFPSDARTLLPSSFQFSPIRVLSQLLLPKSQKRDISRKSQTQIFQIIFAKALKGSKVQRMLQRGPGGTVSDPNKICYFNDIHGHLGHQRIISKVEIWVKNILCHYVISDMIIYGRMCLPSKYSSINLCDFYLLMVKTKHLTK